MPEVKRSPVRRLIRWLALLLLTLLAFAALYGLAMVLLPLVGSNTDYTAPPTGHTIYLHSNGVHTDIVLPVRTETKDWSRTFPFANTSSGDSTFTHIGIGWGDKGFYLETKEWADLKASTAVKAAFGLSGSALHVTYQNAPDVGEDCRAVVVNDSTLHLLVQRIEAGFVKNSDDAPQWIAERYYGEHDAFYEGTGRYGLFHTCNTWTNSTLKECGLPAALWTATAGGVLRQYH
ncbi:MAG: TIGR02117 family protein [Flavobacteriales bacterium]|nr:MAG: TIGR02117 family protein [Flavobacteriales bacterium]